MQHAGWVRVRRYIVNQLPLHDTARVICTAGNNRITLVLNEILKCLAYLPTIDISEPLNKPLVPNNIMDYISSATNIVKQLINDYCPRTQLLSQSSEVLHIGMITYMTPNGLESYVKMLDGSSVPQVSYGLMIPNILQVVMDDVVYAPCPLIILLSIEPIEPNNVTRLGVRPHIGLPIKQSVDEIVSIYTARQLSDIGQVLSNDVEFSTLTSAQTSTMSWPPLRRACFTATTVADSGIVSAIHSVLATVNKGNTLKHIIEGWSSQPYSSKLSSHYLPLFDSTPSTDLTLRGRIAADVVSKVPSSLLTTNNNSSQRWGVINDSWQLVSITDKYNLIDAADQPAFITMLDYIPPYEENAEVISSGQYKFELPPFIPSDTTYIEEDSHAVVNA